MALLLTLTAILTGCGDKKSNKTDLAAIKEKGEIVIGVDDTFAPMGFKDDKGQLVGFDIDLANKVGEKLGVKVKFQTIDWSMKETELNNKNIDLIWNGYTITDARKEKVNFTQAYLNNKQVIITLAKSSVNSKGDLKGKTVSLQKESSALEAVTADKTFTKNLKGGEPIQFDTNNEALQDLEAGRSDAVVVDEVLARYYMKQKGADKFKILKDNFGDEEYGIGVRKDDKELLKQLDEILTQYKNDGTYKQVYDKWLA